MPLRHRYYTFAVVGGPDCPYLFAYDALYCQWSYDGPTNTCSGYLQYLHPRLCPSYSLGAALFEPSSIYPAGLTTPTSAFSFGEPKLPRNPFVGSKSQSPQASARAAFIAQCALQDEAQAVADRKASIKRKSDELEAIRQADLKVIIERSKLRAAHRAADAARALNDEHYPFYCVASPLYDDAGKFVRFIYSR